MTQRRSKRSKSGAAPASDTSRKKQDQHVETRRAAGSASKSGASKPSKPAKDSSKKRSRSPRTATKGSSEEGDRKRAKRPKAARTAPKRSFKHMRVDEPNPADARAGKRDVEGNAAPDFVRRFVEDAYRVVEDNLRSGQEFARQIAGQLPYAPFGADAWGAMPFAGPLSMWLNAMTGAFAPQGARGWPNPFDSGASANRSGYVPDATPPEDDVGLHPQSSSRYRRSNGAASEPSGNGKGAAERRLVVEDVERRGFGRLEGVVRDNGTARRVRLEFLD